jgi:hypothetical protein
MRNTIFITIVYFLISSNLFGQVEIIDSIRINYDKIYSFCLDGNISAVLKEFNNYDKNKLSVSDKLFIAKFETRFSKIEDNSNFLNDHSSKIDSLLKLFHSYWRMSLLEPSKNFDSLFAKNLNIFLSKTMLDKNTPVITNDSLDYQFNKYIKTQKLFATNGIGKTGKLYDLLVWKTQKDTTYNFNIGNEKISANVIFMTDFITLGWEEYATLGTYYPGGWTTKKALFCVKSAYDLNSESFLISYLAHEGRHFKDYILFPKLKNSADLEYRAKLTELSLAKKTLFELIEFFINNANINSDNGHQVADFCVIRDISKFFFKTDFEKDISKWKSLKPEQINKVAYKVLKENTKQLMKKAKTVERYIN